MPPKKTQKIKNSTVQIGDEYYNVGERAFYYDSICVAYNVDKLGIQPNGWFTTFALMGAGQNHSFFNVRNRGNCQLAYCNLDTRDQTPFGFQADSISCSFWGPNPAYFQDTIVSRRYYLPHAIWAGVLPQHCSLTLRVQQDDKLNINAMQAVSGYGPIGGGYGQGPASPGLSDIGWNYPVHLAATQGLPSPEGPFTFTKSLNIPRHANVSVLLKLTEYAAQLLQTMPGPQNIAVWEPAGATKDMLPVMFGITVRLEGKRLVQQRGQLHK